MNLDALPAGPFCLILIDRRRCSVHASHLDAFDALERLLGRRARRHTSRARANLTQLADPGTPLILLDARPAVALLRARDARTRDAVSGGPVLLDCGRPDSLRIGALFDGRDEARAAARALNTRQGRTLPWYVIDCVTAEDLTAGVA